jgi:uroporphyrinogen-III synthase
VLIQLYGQDNPRLLTSLQKLGATPIAVSIYSHSQASDDGAVQDLIQKILRKEIDAITFTSATQVPFLFNAADKLDSPATFRQRLKKDIVIVSVGEITSKALRDAGVAPHVEPTEPKMGPMVKALGDYFQEKEP